MIYNINLFVNVSSVYYNKITDEEIRENESSKSLYLANNKIKYNYLL